MQRTQVLQQVVKFLGDTFVVSIEPDLPHLLNAPDVLVGSSGRLGALFLPKLSELRSVEQLAVRLALSRLALPRHAKCLLVIDPDRPNDAVLKQMERDFHYIIEARDSRRIRSILSENHANDKVEVVPDKIRAQVFLRSSILFDEAIKRYRYREKGRLASEVLAEALIRQGYYPAPLNSWSSSDRSQRRRKEKSILQRGSIILSGEQRKDKRSVIEELREYTIFSTEVDFNLDQGIPYPNNNTFATTTKFFLSDNVPVNRYDPEKYIRAAAFAGVMITRADSLDDIEYTGEVILHRTREAFV